MHLYKKISQTLLVLSVLNPVFAAPIPRGTNTVSGGTTPSQYSSSDGSPPHSLALEGSAPFQVSAPSSVSDGSAPPSHLSATDGQVVSAQDLTTEASTFAHPLSAVDGAAPVSDPITGASTPSYHSSATDTPVPVHDLTAEGSTTGPYTAVTHDMLDRKPKFYEKPMTKEIGLTVLALGAVAAYWTAIGEWAHHMFKD